MEGTAGGAQVYTSSALKDVSWYAVVRTLPRPIHHMTLHFTRPFSCLHRIV